MNLAATWTRLPGSQAALYRPVGPVPSMHVSLRASPCIRDYSFTVEGSSLVQATGVQTKGTKYSQLSKALAQCVASSTANALARI
eukprot:6397320-Amphidinium_carterae.1